MSEGDFDEQTTLHKLLNKYVEVPEHKCLEKWKQPTHVAIFHNGKFYSNTFPRTFDIFLSFVYCILFFHWKFNVAMTSVFNIFAVVANCVSRALNGKNVF